MNESAARTGLKVVSRLPASLRRDYLRRGDRAIADIIEVCGAPPMSPWTADALLAGPHRHGVVGPGLLGGPQRVLPVRASPQFQPWASDVSQRSSEAAQDLAPPGSNVRIRRIPYAIAAETSMGASSANVANDPSLYLNGTGYRFMVTHVTMSEALEPLLLIPSYSLRITPQSGIPWIGTTKLPATGLLTSRIQMTIPSNNGMPLCVWSLDAEYVAGPSHSFFCTADNPAASGAIRADLTFIAYKLNPAGSPRIFSQGQALAASATGQAFNSINFQGDGDFPFAVTDILMSAGTGAASTDTWLTAAGQTCPRYFVRSDSDREFTARSTLAVSLNTGVGSLGCFLRLRNPQPIAPNTSVTLEFTNNKASARTANVGLLGYLEQPIAGGVMAAA